MAELRRHATELVAAMALDEQQRRRAAAELARRQVLGRRIQEILFLIRVTRSLEHTWADIVEFVQEQLEDEKGLQWLQTTTQPRREAGLRTTKSLV